MVWPVFEECERHRETALKSTRTLHTLEDTSESKIDHLSSENNMIKTKINGEENFLFDYIYIQLFHIWFADFFASFLHSRLFSHSILEWFNLHHFHIPLKNCIVFSRFNYEERLRMYLRVCVCMGRAEIKRSNDGL